MAVIEQLMYGRDVSRPEAGRTVLARSSGVSRDCAAELARICEAWGDTPHEVGFWPVLLSFPLKTMMPALPGRLFAVIRICDGCGAKAGEEMDPDIAQSRDLDSILTESASTMPSPLYHAVVLREVDYAAFGMNPFGLAQEDLFLNHWAPGLILERRTLESTSLAPLVSPLPSEQDAEQIGEALCSLLAKRKLILPLEQSDAQCDRFFALLIAALPLSIKRELRFASFVVTEANDYTLAAVYRSTGKFRQWQRLFLASPPEALSKTQADYLESVKSCLLRGDLMGLEQASRTGCPTGGTAVAARRTGKSETLAATLAAKSPPRPAPTPWNQSMPVAKAAHIAPSQPPGSRPLRSSPPRSRPARRRAPGRAPSWLVPVSIVIILFCGALFLLNQHGGNWWPWNSSQESASEANSTLLGVIDVGALYKKELARFHQARSGPDSWHPQKDPARSLETLRIGAADELDQQSRLFVQLARQGVQQPARPDREGERLGALAQRGSVLEQEMHRLLLAYYAFLHDCLWRDLGDLPRQKLSARYDSLRRRHPERLNAIAKELALAGEVAELTAARARTENLGRLSRLLGQQRKDSGWTGSLERTAQTLAAYSLSGADDAYRQSALQMVKLKKSEEDADLGQMAFRTDYEQGQWLPPSIAQRLPEMRAQRERSGAENVPPLFAATVDFYAELECAPERLQSADVSALSGWLLKLAKNRALAFDPACYADHVDRLRVAAVGALRAEGVDVSSLPEHFFPGGQPGMTQSFLDLSSCGPTAEEWREVAQASPLPFFASWATAQARSAELAVLQASDRFDRAHLRLNRQAADLMSRARHGQDCSGEFIALDRELAELQSQFGWRLRGDPERQPKLEQLAALHRAMKQPLQATLQAITVRFAASALSQPVDVIVELTGSDGQTIYCTPAFAIGPAAPAGTGWVGTCTPAVSVDLIPGQSLRVVVRSSQGREPLLEVLYDSEHDGLIPTALARQRPGRDPRVAPSVEAASCGSVAFKLSDDYWRGIELPLSPRP